MNFLFKQIHKIGAKVMKIDERIEALEQKVKALEESLEARYQEIGEMMTILENLDSYYVRVTPAGVTPHGYQPTGESLRQ